MKIKETGYLDSIYNEFDISDSQKNETGLSKNTAYLIGKDFPAFGKFLQSIGITIKSNRQSCLKSASIIIEKDLRKSLVTDERGRTDIEIEFTDNKINYHIIVECKINSNKAHSKQYEKYKALFNDTKADKKIFVFLTDQSSEINLHEDDEKIDLINLNWRELINNLSDTRPKSELLKKFLTYFERCHGMSNQKEILIQDVSAKDEVNRYKNRVYRRDKVSGSPLYFAPYFTNKNEVDDSRGINGIRKILGIITTKNINWEKVHPTCKKFLDQIKDMKDDDKKEHLKDWKKALENDDIGEKEATYFFLGDEVEIQPSLKKIPGEFLMQQITRNYTLSFAELLSERNKVINYENKIN